MSNKKRKKKNKRRKKIRRKLSRRVKKIKKRIKKLSKRRKSKKIKSSEPKELIFKVPKRWSKRAYVDKKQYEKNINCLLKIMMVFGEKREKELIG